ncbi:MAG: hypothetical protein H6731_08205 [Myxococcales bacterium]|nr:MAG: hypothetical protein H6731_08205 [Myxococcales bacterium]
MNNFAECLSSPSLSWLSELLAARIITTRTYQGYSASIPTTVPGITYFKTTQAPCGC